MFAVIVVVGQMCRACNMGLVGTELMVDVGLKSM